MPYGKQLPLSSNIKGSAQLRTPCFKGMDAQEEVWSFYLAKRLSPVERTHASKGPISEETLPIFFGTPDLESQRITNLKATIGENTIKPLRRFDKSIFPLFFILLDIPQLPFYKTERLSFAGLN